MRTIRITKIIRDLPPWHNSRHEGVAAARSRRSCTVSAGAVMLSLPSRWRRSFAQGAEREFCAASQRGGRGRAQGRIWACTRRGQAPPPESRQQDLRDCRARRRSSSEPPGHASRAVGHDASTFESDPTAPRNRPPVAPRFRLLLSTPSSKTPQRLGGWGVSLFRSSFGEAKTKKCPPKRASIGQAKRSIRSGSRR